MHKDTNKKQLNDTEEKLHGLENTGSRYRDLSSCAAYVRKAHMPRFRMVDSSAAAELISQTRGLVEMVSRAGFLPGMVDLHFLNNHGYH